MYTKGTWRVMKQPEGLEKEVIVCDGFIVAITTSDYKTLDYKANAQLIASAPDLLEACRDAIDEILSPSGVFGKDTAIRKLEQAIDKAEGKIK